MFIVMNLTDPPRECYVDEELARGRARTLNSVHKANQYVVATISDDDYEVLVGNRTSAENLVAAADAAIAEADRLLGPSAKEAAENLWEGINKMGFKMGDGK